MLERDNWCSGRTSLRERMWIAKSPEFKEYTRLDLRFVLIKSVIASEWLFLFVVLLAERFDAFLFDSLSRSLETSGKHICTIWRTKIWMLRRIWLFSLFLSIRTALDKLGLHRYCCRRMVLTHVDLIETLLKYSSLCWSCYFMCRHSLR